MLFMCTSYSNSHIFNFNYGIAICTGCLTPLNIIDGIVYCSIVECREFKKIKKRQNLILFDNVIPIIIIDKNMDRIGTLEMSFNVIKKLTLGEVRKFIYEFFDGKEVYCRIAV